MSDLLIRNAQVLRMVAEQAVLAGDQDILIHGNRIEAIQDTGRADPSHFSRVVDARGMLAMPGLINTHAHTPMVLWRGLAEDVNLDPWFNDYIWPLEHNLDPDADDVYWGMLLGLVEMIESGVTSVADHYFHMDQEAHAVEQAGTRALLAWAMFSSNGPDMIEQTGDFVRRWQGGANGRIRTCMGPHAPYTCDDEFLHASARKAAELDVAIHIHLSETREQTELMLNNRGITPVQLVERLGLLDQPTILAHVCGATPGDIEILSQYRVGIAHTPKTYMKLAMGYTPVVEFRQAGIAVGLGSDGACSNNTLNLWEVMRLMAMLQKIRTADAEKLSIPQALQIATRESATVFGLPDDLGDLAPGKLADLILVDLSGAHHTPLHSVTASLVYNTQAPDVRTVIVDGEIVMLDREILTLDKAEILDQARRRMARMAQRDTSKRIQSYNP